MAKADGFEMLKGHVEIDEAYIGGYRAGGNPGAGDNKTIVLGIVERGGRTVAKAVPNLRKETIRPFVYENIRRDRSSLPTKPILRLTQEAGYDHKSVNHSKYEWRKYNYRRDECHHTNSVEVVLEAVQKFNSQHAYSRVAGNIWTVI